MITLTLQAETTFELQSQLHEILSGAKFTDAPAVVATAAPATTPAPAVESVQTAEVEDLGNKSAAKPGRKKVTPPQTIEAAAKDATPPAEAAGFTIEETRELMKDFADKGHMDDVSDALKARNTAKVSGVDPDAKPGEKSAKFAEFIDDIKKRIAAKKAA